MYGLLSVGYACLFTTVICIICFREEYLKALRGELGGAIDDDIITVLARILLVISCITVVCQIILIIL